MVTNIDSPSTVSSEDLASNGKEPHVGLLQRAGPWLLVLTCALASLVLYALLLRSVSNLIHNEGSFAQQLLPGAELILRDSCLAVCSTLNLAEAVVIHSAASLSFLAMVLALFLVYGVALRAVARRESTLLGATVFIAGAAFQLLMWVSPALLSGDVYSYIMYGRIAAIHGDDPYTEVPASYPDDPYLAHVFWARDPTYYGPIWTLLSRGLVLLGGEHVGLSVLLFRTLASASALIIGGLIWWSLARLRPDRAIQGLVFFLWNPLVVLEAGLSAHNDIFMLVFVVLAAALHLTGRYALASTALIVSMLVKIVSAPVLPLYILMALRQLPDLKSRARFLLVSGLLGTLAVGIALVVNRTGPQILTVGSLGVSSDRYQNSLHELAFNWLRQASGREPEWDEVPAYFQPHWLGAHTAGELWSDTEQIGIVRQWSTLLALSPQRGEWVRVYDLAGGRIGYVQARAVGPVERPEGFLGADVVRLEAGPRRSPDAVEANTLLRLISWPAFGLVWLLAAWRVRDTRSFLVWSTVVLLAYYWLAAAWIWPWYVTWAVALGALVTDARVAGLAALLSATVLTLYPSLGFEGSTENRIFVYRSLPAFVLPLVLWSLWLGAQRMIARFRS